MDGVILAIDLGKFNSVDIRGRRRESTDRVYATAP
jgi:hypothetical protein